MILCCGKCKYVFSYEKFEKQCPDCGKFAVRVATEQEIQDYKRIRIELVNEKW